MPAGCRAATRWALIGVVAGALLALTPQAALAHPYGPPPRAEISVRGDAVTVRWTAETDDIVILALHLGILDPSDVRWTEEAGPEVLSGQLRLSSSEAVRAYLLEHVQVAQGGAQCGGSVDRVGDMVAAPAVLTYACRQPLDTVAIRIGLLHDIHPAYRTFGHFRDGGDPPHAVFTHALPEHEFTVHADPGGAPERGLLVVAGGLLAGLVTLPLIGLRTARRLRRH